ncbi:MAG TPA: hypothetical protein VGP72_05560 [Planctomycetota bacterium]
MSPRISLSKVKNYFDHIYDRLFSRIRRLSRRFADPHEAAAEMVASSWINLLQKAQRCGRWLTPGALAWVAYRRYRNGRMVAPHGNSTKDVLADACYRAGRVRVYRISAPRVEYSEQDEMAISLALSTRERESPSVRAATRIDWAAFSARLPHRLRRLLRYLALGYSKTQCGEKLALSNGRITQLLYVLADELKAFFGADIVPSAA